MHNRYLQIGALLAAVSIALGAFGAHKLKQILSLDATIVFETAVRYQMYHAFALLFVGILYEKFNIKWLKKAAIFFIIGLILFCGSLYILAFKNVLQIEWLKYFGAVAPIGGLSFIVAWLCMVIAIAKPKAE